VKKLLVITQINFNKGFSLIEVVVCLSLAVILTLTLFYTLVLAFGTIKITRIQNDMNYTLQSIIENIKAGNIDYYLDHGDITSLNNEELIEFTIENYKCSIRTTKEAFESIYMVELDIKYQKGKANISQNLSTFLPIEYFQ